jgi:cAMP-dependent protein kinase regulator
MSTATPPPAAFDPAAYCPRQASQVELFDRGPAEPERSRYVLMRDEGRRQLVLSESEKLLWELCDGKSSVQDICQRYLARHRTLILTRLYSLLQQLWHLGFLTNDPHIAAPTEATTPPWWQRLRFTHWLACTVPGSAALVRLLAAAVGKVCPPALLEARLFTMLLTVVAAAGVVLFSSLPQAAHLNLLLPGGTYRLPGLGWTLPESYLSGIVLIFVIHLVCSFLRHLVRAVTEAVFTGRASPLVVEVNYGLPCWHDPLRWVAMLPARRRLIVGAAGTTAELCAAGLGTLALHLDLTSGGLTDLLYKAVWVLYLRSFLHFAPFSGSDFPQIVSLLSNLPHLPRNAYGYLRHSLVPTLLSDAPLTAEHRYYFSFNLVAAFWLGLAAVFSFSLLSANEYLVHNLVYVFTHANELLATPAAPSAGEDLGAVANDMTRQLALMARERYVLLATVGLFLLLLLSSLAAALAWGLYVFWKWLARLPCWQSPRVLVAAGMALLIVVLVGIAFLLHFAVVDAERGAHLLRLATYVVGLGGSIYLARQLPPLGNSWRQVRALALVLAMLAATAAVVVQQHVRAAHEPAVLLSVLVLGLLAVALVVGVCQQQHLYAVRNTDFLLPELATLIGMLVLAVSALRVLGGSTGADTVVAQNRLVGCGLIVLGLAIALRLSRQLNTRLDSLAVDLSHDDQGQALKRVIAYALEGVARLVAVRHGDHALPMLEARMSRGDAQFAFSNLDLPEDATPAAIGQLYRDRLTRLHDLIGRLYGRHFADQVFDAVFRKIHWECREVLQDLLFPGSRWAQRYADEEAFPGTARTQLISSISMFQDLAPAERQLLVRHSTLQRFAKGQRIVRQGDYGDTCYIVVSGEVQVEEQSLTGSRQIVAFLREGDFFGETALLQHTPRVATVRATSDVRLLALAREDFDKFGTQFPEMVHRVKDRLNNLQTLLRIPLFGDLPPNLLRAVLPRVRANRFEPGDIIITQGEVGKHFYLIKTGQVEVFAVRGTAEESICELGPRDYFGEIALLRDIPRTATVKARDVTEVLMLDKNDFLALLRGSQLFAQSVSLTGDQRLAAV